MSADPAVFEETAEDLFESAPCGYLATDMAGTLVRVNRTFEEWTGLRREKLVGRRRFAELLTVGGRIYYETHCSPLLHMQDAIREIAVEVVRADGTRMPALVNAVLRRDRAGEPRGIRITVFDATDRRRYEQELLDARRRERAVVERLQRSMLAGALPSGRGIEVGAAYRSAAAGLEVGGDWFDAFWLDDEESVGLVVGDVVGRGLDAAATMAQLRSAVRALATRPLGPAALLDALDAYVRRFGVGRMTTVACARLHVPSGAVRYACAGHPPPIALAPDGGATVLWGGRSMPLDALPEFAPRTDAQAEVAPGGSLLLYTDGLVERRFQVLDEGIAALALAFSNHPGVAAAELADRLVRSVGDTPDADDQCALVAALAGG